MSAITTHRFYTEEIWNYSDHFGSRTTADLSKCQHCGCVDPMHSSTTIGNVDPKNGLSFHRSICKCGTCEYWIFADRSPVQYIWYNPRRDPTPSNNLALKDQLNRIESDAITAGESLEKARATRVLEDAINTIALQTKTIENLKSLIRVLRKGSCDPDAPCDKIEDDEPGTYVCGYHE